MTFSKSMYTTLWIFLAECKEPMGLESGSTGILTASSFFDAETSAEYGRMGSDSAWAAGVNNVNQYLQVYFQCK